MNCFGSAFRLALLVVVSALVSLGGTAFAATKQPGFPVPHITAPTVPTAVAPGGPGFTLKVYGANFINGSVVNWNKQARTTTFVSGHELDAQILASDIATNRGQNNFRGSTSRPLRFAFTERPGSATLAR